MGEIPGKWITRYSTVQKNYFYAFLVAEDKIERMILLLFIEL